MTQLHHLLPALGASDGGGSFNNVYWWLLLVVVVLTIVLPVVYLIGRPSQPLKH